MTFRKVSVFSWENKYKIQICSIICWFRNTPPLPDNVMMTITVLVITSYLCCDPASQTVSYENINMDHISGKTGMLLIVIVILLLLIVIVIILFLLLVIIKIRSNQDGQVFATRGSTSQQW